MGRTIKRQIYQNKKKLWLEYDAIFGERTKYILETKHKLYLEYFWKKSYVLQF